ncbi:kinase-like domain-containing protein [Xylaria grammica]|nr:kinase-like domain-containing protein [Xylaria grammica]
MATSRQGGGMDHADADSGVPIYDDEDYLLLPFGADSLRSWATSIRNTLISNGDIATYIANPVPVVCTGVLASMPGSYNIVFPLQFNDGVRWALKVPQGAALTGFSTPAARSMATEVLVLYILRQQTTIPVPRVHHFYASMNGSLKYPYILTDFIEGIPLDELWFNNEIPDDELLSFRTRVLQDLAKAMVQLDRFRSRRGGAPKFNSRDQLYSVGDLRTVDIAASDGEFGGSGDDTPVWCNVGPFTHAESYILALFDRQESPTQPFEAGIRKLLMLFVLWLSELDDYDNQDFVLTHPDLDLQNILVTKEGNITGIIDWEGVAVVPACLGNLCYPPFLTYDWCSAVRDSNPGESQENAAKSSQELQHLRAVYLDIIEGLYRSMGTQCPATTRRSIVIKNLKLAADDPFFTRPVVERVFRTMKQDAGKPLAVDGWELNLREVARNLAQDAIDTRTINVLKEGFLHIFNSL